MTLGIKWDHPTPAPQQNTRARILQTAEGLVNGDRNVQYGDPRADFQRTADMWSAYLGVDVAPHDVAALMCLLKVSRIRWSPEKEDSWVDLAGYAACGADCALPSVPVDEAQPAPNYMPGFRDCDLSEEPGDPPPVYVNPNVGFEQWFARHVAPQRVLIYDEAGMREVYPDGDPL